MGPIAYSHTFKTREENKKKLRDKTQNGKIIFLSMMVEIESAYHAD